MFRESGSRRVNDVLAVNPPCVHRPKNQRYHNHVADPYAAEKIDCETFDEIDAHCRVRNPSEEKKRRYNRSADADENTFDQQRFKRDHKSSFP
jgi:hypothetical protein